MTPPQTQYARSGDVRIAYQVIGNGAVRPWCSCPATSRTWIFTGMVPPGPISFTPCRLSRLILFDKRGNGLSIRMAGSGTLEERMDDVAR